MFHCIIFKIIKALILNANTTNTKQLSGPEKIPWLSRNRPLVSNTSTTGSNKKATVFDALSTNLMSQKKTSNEIGANKRMKNFFSLTCAICLDSYVIARDLYGLLIINIFSLYVLFSHSRPRDGTPENFSFKFRLCRRPCAYYVRSIYFEKVNFIENITCSKLGKRNLQTKGVFSKHEIGGLIS